jgi:hypothetical protein
MVLQALVVDAAVESAAAMRSASVGGCAPELLELLLPPELLEPPELELLPKPPPPPPPPQAVSASVSKGTTRAVDRLRDLARIMRAKLLETSTVDRAPAAGRRARR